MPVKFCAAFATLIRKALKFWACYFNSPPKVLGMQLNSFLQFTRRNYFNVAGLERSLFNIGIQRKNLGLIYNIKVIFYKLFCDFLLRSSYHLVFM